MTGNMPEILRDNQEPQDPQRGEVVPAEKLQRAIRKRDFEPNPLDAPKTVLGSADRSALDALRNKTREYSSGVDTLDDEELQEVPVIHPKKGIPLQVKFGAALAGALALVGGVAGYNKINSSEDSTSKEAVTTPMVVIPGQTAEPTSLTTPPAPEATLTPEIKSTPYTIVNEKTYLDGRLTLGIVDGVQIRTKGPKSIVPGIYEGEEVAANSSSGFEINPNMEGADKNVVDLINAGLLLAWSSQTNIPSNQRDLITSLDESREMQMSKWKQMQERAQNGEKFEVTLRAYKNDGFTEEDVRINIGEDYKYKIDQLVKPPVQIKWQSNAGSGFRISNENKEFRIEFYDQYAGGYGTWAEKVFLSSIIVQTIGYLPELVVDEGKIMRSDVTKPGFDFQVNVVRDILLTLAQKYDIIPDANPGTYSKDWKDSAIHPLP